MAASRPLRRRSLLYHVMLTNMMAGGFCCCRDDHSVPIIVVSLRASKEEITDPNIRVLTSLCVIPTDTDLIGVYIVKHASRLPGAWHCRERGRMGTHISARAP